MLRALPPILRLAVVSGLLLGGYLEDRRPMTEQQPDNLDQFDAKLQEAARERIEGSGTRRTRPRRHARWDMASASASNCWRGLLVGSGDGLSVIDGWLGTRPWLMLVFMILGLGGGILNVMRVTKQMEQLEASKKDQR